MVHHIVAYSESVDQTLAPLAAVTDEVLSVNGDNVTIAQNLQQILAAWQGSASAERGRITAPSLQAKLLPDLMPVDDANEPTDPELIHDFRHCPIKLVPGDDLQLLHENDGAGAAERANGLYILATGTPSNEESAAWLPLRFTFTPGASTNQWNTAVGITLDQTLLAGKYAVGGAFIAVPAGGTWAARFLFPGQVQRPGCLVYDDVNDHGHEMFSCGKLGTWGTFESPRALPTLQTISTSDDSGITGEGILYVRRV